MKLDWHTTLPYLAHCQHPEQDPIPFVVVPNKRRRLPRKLSDGLPLKGETDTAFFGERKS